MSEMLNGKTGVQTVRNDKVKHVKRFWGMKGGEWAIFFVCIIFAVICLFPLWIMFMNATRSATEILQAGGVEALIPSTNLFGNIEKLFNDDQVNVLRGFVNSLIVSLGSTFLCVYFSALTAYGFVGYNFKFKSGLFAILLASMLIPSQLGMIGWFQLVTDLNMYDTWIPLILPSIASATTVFFLKQYFEASFSKDIIEAARIDGSSEFGTFNRIIIPISVPALATMAIFSFVYSWNNYMGPLMILSSKELATLPMEIANLKASTHDIDYGAMYVGLVISVLPLIIIYLAFSKFIIGGLTLGSVKE